MIYQHQIEAMTEQEYSFYLAHGVIDDEELQLQELCDAFTVTDVEM